MQAGRRGEIFSTCSVLGNYGDYYTDDYSIFLVLVILGDLALAELFTG